MKLTRVLTLMLVAGAWSVGTARADMKMVASVAGKGVGMQANVTSTTYIKGLKMRTESVVGDGTRVMIFDVENQKLYMFDLKKKEADVWDMADFAQQAGMMANPAGMTAAITPNGQTKQINGRTATGYDMAISMPPRADDKSPMKATVNLTGPVWIAKGAPGTDDYLRFYKGAADRGFIFSDPRAAKAQPGQAKATLEMYRQLAAAGGVPYETEMNIKMTGDGPMAGLMARAGNISMTQTVQSVETAALPDDLFAPPAGYKLSPKK